MQKNVSSSEMMLPREKMISKGVDSLTNPELLAIVFNTGTIKQDVFSLTKSIVGDYDFSHLKKYRSVREVISKFNLSTLKACQLISILEFGRRLFNNSNKVFPLVNDSSVVYELNKDIKTARKEHLRVLCLNARLRLIYSEIVCIGSLNFAACSPKEILLPALESNASGIILVHNHPSGEVSPSNDDIIFTKSVTKAAEILGVEFIDHVIVGSSGYMSLKSMMRQEIM